MKKVLLAAALAAAPLAATHAAVIISEVHPNGSSTATYGSDFFELTNTGPTAVDLSGWKMDDNSFAAASAVALRGVTSLPAGKSVVFIENNPAGTTDDAAKGAQFVSAWFGGTAPAGFTIGYYGGANSGVSLSSGGDGVIVYDASNNAVTAVNFGSTVATAAFTLDNRAGVGGITSPYPSVSTNSVVGTGGAFTSATGGEVGSPGVVPEPTALLTTALAAVGLLARRR